MTREYFGRLPKEPTGLSLMTRDGHFGFIESVNGNKVETTCGTFPKRDVMVRRYMECGDAVTDGNDWFVIKSRTMMRAVLASKDGECVRELYELKRASCFYPGERVEHNKREYVVIGAASGILVLKNEEGYGYADMRNLRALDVKERLNGELTLDFSELPEEDIQTVSFTCELLSVVRNLRYLKWTNKDIINAMRIKI